MIYEALHRQVRMFVYCSHPDLLLLRIIDVVLFRRNAWNVQNSIGLDISESLVDDNDCAATTRLQWKYT